MSKYKEIGGTSYRFETPQEVIDILERSRINRTKIRVFFGDVTGRDWMEEYDTMGHVGRSTGEIKVPLLIPRATSSGGGALIDSSIVKITIDKITVYQHPNYRLPALRIAPVSTGSSLEQKGYTHMVYADDVNTGNFKSLEKAEKYVEFLRGERNTK